MDAKTDNLVDLGEEDGYVFRKESEVRTLPDHTISFALPAGLNKTDFQTTRFTGRVVYMEFRSVVNDDDASETSSKFIIHRQEFKMPKAWQSVHRRGMEMAKQAQTAEGVIILGAEEIRPPVGLLLTNVHVHMGRDGPTSEEWASLLGRINEKTGRELRVIPVPNSNVLVIPATWILQDLTAIASSRQKDAKTAVTEIKNLIYAFPNLGAKVIYMKEGEQLSGIVSDFDVVQDGQRVEVTLIDPEEQLEDDYLLYSNIYVEVAAKEMAKRPTLEDLQKKARNPVIVRVISPQDRHKMQEVNKEAGVPNYVVEAQNYLFDRLKSWWVWNIDRAELKVLASEYPKQSDNRNVRKEKETKLKTFWVSPREAIDNSGLKIVSFETGECYIGDQCFTISHNEKREVLADRDDIVDIHEMPEEVDITSLVFNAVIGTAKTAVDGKAIQCFFSTYNGVDISMTEAPLFTSVPPTNRVCVDVKQVKWVIGYQGKGQQPGHENKIVVYWAAIPEAFKNFYIWVMKRGDPAHKLFKGKTISQVREMFVCDEFPNLVDAFNFMTDGFTLKNPTRDSSWTRFFMTKCLLIDPSDLE